MNVFFDKNLNGANLTWIGMFSSEHVNATVYNNWNLTDTEYLKFLVSDNNVIVFSTSNAGYNNMTIGYEEYVNSVRVNLAKIKKIGVSSGKKVFGFPISNHDEEKNIVIYQK